MAIFSLQNVTQNVTTGATIAQNREDREEPLMDRMLSLPGNIEKRRLRDFVTGSFHQFRGFRNMWPKALPLLAQSQRSRPSDNFIFEADHSVHVSKIVGRVDTDFSVRSPKKLLHRPSQTGLRFQLFGIEISRSAIQFPSEPIRSLQRHIPLFNLAIASDVSFFGRKFAGI